MTITIFNRAMIEGWNQELTDIAKRRAHLEQTIQMREQTLNTMHEEQDSLTASRNAALRIKLDIMGQITATERKIADTQRSLRYVTRELTEIESHQRRLSQRPVIRDTRSLMSDVGFLFDNNPFDDQPYTTRLHASSRMTPVSGRHMSVSSQHTHIDFNASLARSVAASAYPSDFYATSYTVPNTHQQTLESQRASIMSQQHSLDNELHQLEARLKNTVNELANLQLLQREKSNRARSYEVDNVIATAKTELAQLEQKQQRLQYQITDAKQFLTDLAASPDAIVGNWLQMIKFTLKNYVDNSHGLSTTAEWCLFEVDKILAAIEQYQVETPKQEPSLEESHTERLYPDLHMDENEPQPSAPRDLNSCIKYSVIAGFLWEMYDKSKKDTSFSNEVYNLLKLGHIERDGDLPDEFALHSNCYQQYVQFKEKHPSLFSNISLADFPKFKFDNAMARLAEFANADNQPMNQLAKQLANEIGKEVTRTKKESQSLDYHLYAKLINLACTIGNNQAKGNDISDFLELAAYLPSKASSKNIVAGIALAMVSLTILSLSSVALVATYGTSTPVSVKGYALSASLMAKSIYLMGGLGGSLGCLYSGNHLFANNTLKGLPLAALQYIEANNQRKAMITH